VVLVTQLSQTTCVVEEAVVYKRQTRVLFLTHLLGVGERLVGVIDGVTDSCYLVCLSNKVGLDTLEGIGLDPKTNEDDVQSVLCHTKKVSVSHQGRMSVIK